MKLGDRQAFPLGDYTNGGENGMTLRQYYAGLAMQGMLANAEITLPNEVCISEAAMKIADALLAELEK